MERYVKFTNGNKPDAPYFRYAVIQPKYSCPPHPDLLRIAVVEPVDKKNESAFTRQVVAANVAPPPRASSSSGSEEEGWTTRGRYVPGTVYVNVNDVKYCLEMSGIPKPSIFPRESLETCPRIEKKYMDIVLDVEHKGANAYPKSKRPSYTTKTASYVTLANLHTYLVRGAAPRHTRNVNKKTSLYDRTNVENIAHKLWVFWTKNPEDLPLDITDDAELATPEHQESVSRTPIQDNSTGVPEGEEPLESSGEDTSSSSSLSLGSVSRHMEKEKDRGADEFYTHLRSWRPLQSTRKTSPLSVAPMKKRVIEFLLPLAHQEDNPLTAPLPKGVLLNFYCAPINFGDTREWNNAVVKYDTLDGGSGSISQRDYEERTEHKILSTGNLWPRSSRRGNKGSASVWLPTVRSNAAHIFFKWDTLFAELHYREDPGTALLPANHDFVRGRLSKQRQPKSKPKRKRKIFDPIRRQLEVSKEHEKSNEEGSFSCLPRNDRKTSHDEHDKEETVRGQKLVEDMEWLKKTQAKRVPSIRRRPKQMMYVPCISADDLARSGLLPSVYTAMRTVTEKIIGFATREAVFYLFPRITSMEITRRRQASHDTRKGLSERFHAKQSSPIVFDVPPNLERGTREYARFTSYMTMAITYYEIAPKELACDRSFIRDRSMPEDGRTASKKKRKDRSKSHKVTVRSDVDRFLYGDENSVCNLDVSSSCETFPFALGPNDSVLDSLVSGNESSRSYSSGAAAASEDSDFATSWSTSENNSGLDTESSGSHRIRAEAEEREDRHRLYGKPLSICRSFCVRRVDNLKKATSQHSGIEWSAEPFVSLRLLERLYLKQDTPNNVKIKLPQEHYLMIPVWLFPMVVMHCQNDALYQGLKYGGQFSYLTNLLDDSITRAQNLGKMPDGIALECKTLLRCAASFFEFMNKENLEERIAENEKTAYMTRGAVLELIQDLRAEKDLRSAYDQQHDKLLTHIEGLRKDFHKYTEQMGGMFDRLDERVKDRRDSSKPKKLRKRKRSDGTRSRET